MSRSTGGEVLTSAALARLLDYPSLVARVDQAFMADVLAPARIVIERPGSTILVMAAARQGGLAVIKTVMVGADQSVRSHVTVLSPSGDQVARFDGEELTARRTAAASVRAAALLARPDAVSLAVLGAGPQAAALARAYAQCRPLQYMVIWARRPDRAMLFAQALQRDIAVEVAVASCAAAAVGSADIVTVATRAHAPLVMAADVRPGTHIDLVGGFRPDMREADDVLIARATVVADNDQAMQEAGDLVTPIAAGALQRADVRLLGHIIANGFRRAPAEVTVFKSVGFAGLDLIAAELALERTEAARRGIQ